MSCIDYLIHDKRFAGVRSEIFERTSLLVSPVLKLADDFLDFSCVEIFAHEILKVSQRVRLVHWPHHEDVVCHAQHGAEARQLIKEGMSELHLLGGDVFMQILVHELIELLLVQGTVASTADFLREAHRKYTLRVGAGIVLDRVLLG